MDISISFTLAGKAYEIPSTIVNSFLVVIAISIFCFIVAHKVKKVNYREKPKGIVLVAEIMVNSIDKLVEDTMGKSRVFFAPYILALFFYLVVANLMGLLAFTPPTSDYNVTLTLALITFVLIQVFNIKSNGGWGYIKGFFEPIWFFFPMNIISELSNPISMSFRLFGNILSGVIIMGLVYSSMNSLAWFLTPVVTPVLHAYFDVFSGVLQSFIFVMLTMVLISSAMGDEKPNVKEENK